MPFDNATYFPLVADVPAAERPTWINCDPAGHGGHALPKGADPALLPCTLWSCCLVMALWCAHRRGAVPEVCEPVLRQPSDLVDRAPRPVRVHM